MVQLQSYKGNGLRYVTTLVIATDPHLPFGVRWHKVCANLAWLLIDPSGMP